MLIVDNDIFELIIYLCIRDDQSAVRSEAATIVLDL